jgi:PAS domain S-box-containing protein
MKDVKGRIAGQSAVRLSLISYYSIFAGEMLNKNIFALIHPDDFGQLMNLLAKLLEQPSTITQTEFRFQHKDGTSRSQSWTRAIMSKR